MTEDILDIGAQHVANYVVISVTSVRATAANGFYYVDAHIIDPYGVDTIGDFVVGPDDPFGAGPVLRQWLVDHEGEYEIVPYVAPPPVAYVLLVASIWDRLTEEEAEIFDTTVNTASPLKMRKQFLVATSMWSDSELFTWTKNLLESLFGDARANAVMGR